jgi:hypothetical protein
MSSGWLSFQPELLTLDQPWTSLCKFTIRATSAACGIGPYLSQVIETAAKIARTSPGILM